MSIPSRCMQASCSTMTLTLEFDSDISGNLGVLRILWVYYKRGHGHPCSCSTMNQIDRVTLNESSYFAQPQGQSSNSGRTRPRGPPLLCLRYAVESALANALTSNDTTKLGKDASPSPRPCSPVGIEMTKTARRKLPVAGHYLG